MGRSLGIWQWLLILLTQGMLLMHLHAGESWSNATSDVTSKITSDAACAQSILTALHQPTELAWALCAAHGNHSEVVRRAINQVLLCCNDITDLACRIGVVDRALDDLIQARQAIDPRAMEAVMAGGPFETQVALLMAMTPAAYAWQMQCACSQWPASITRLYVDHLAIEAKAPYLAKRMLQELHLERTYVVDGPHAEGSESRIEGRFFSCCGGRVRTRHGYNDFPADVQYTLSLTPVAGADLVSSTPYQIYAVRTEICASGARLERSADLQPSDAPWMEVHALAGVSTVVSRLAMIHMAWHGPGHFLSDVIHDEQQVSHDYAEILQRLTNAGLLSSEDAASLPLPLTVHIIDMRRSRYALLPTVAGYLGQVEVIPALVSGSLWQL